MTSESSQAAAPAVSPEDWLKEAKRLINALISQVARNDGDDTRRALLAHLALRPEPVRLSDEQIDAIFAAHHNPKESPWVNWRAFARALLAAGTVDAAPAAPADSFQD